MRIIVGCEFSQIVTKAFREKGHEAFSCDLLPTEGKSEWHFQADILEVLKSESFDLAIFHPPCTHLAVSGAPSFAQKRADGRQQEAIDFFMKLVNAPIPKIAVENPVCIMSRIYRKPDQIIQPYYFGDPQPKKTCLWLKNLPLLTWNKADTLFEKQTVVEPEYLIYNSKKNKSGFSKYPLLWKGGKGHGKERSVTFPGIARAMASQWGNL